jgi:hypothetical protein
MRLPLSFYNSWTGSEGSLHPRADKVRVWAENPDMFSAHSRRGPGRTLGIHRRASIGRSWAHAARWNQGARQIGLRASRQDIGTHGVGDINEGRVAEASFGFTARGYRFGDVGRDAERGAPAVRTDAKVSVDTIVQ